MASMTHASQQRSTLKERLIVNTRTVPEEHLNHPTTLTALRQTRLLVTGYLAISVLSLVAIVLLRNHTAQVTSAVWTHGIIVAASALLTFTFTARAVRGSRRAYLRLRIASAIMLAAIAVIIAIPGSFPLWMKIEQGACGLILLGVVAIVNGRQLRSSFAAR
jgi:hypothetical protein